MISLEVILKVHQCSIVKYGGADGVRDLSLLESAISRPFQTFDGIDLYESVCEKAAALFESLIVNHPFIDGNKRTGFLATAALIEHYEYMLTATEEDAYNFTIKISTGEARFEEIVTWLKANTSSL